MGAGVWQYVLALLLAVAAEEALRYIVWRCHKWAHEPSTVVSSIAITRLYLIIAHPHHQTDGIRHFVTQDAP